MANNSDKGRIVFLCTFIMMIFVVLSFISVQKLSESNHVREKDEQVEQQYSLALSLFKTDVDFFGYELNNSEFYKSGNSLYLTRHDSILSKLHQLLEVFDNEEVQEDSILVYLKSYDSTFNEIVEKLKAKGFRDYGLEGKMRDAAHELENKKLISQIEYLQLRRYEKDYLLRADLLYISKFDSLVNNSQKNANAQSAAALKEYASAFHELTTLSDQIGLESQKNLKGTLDRLNNHLLTEIKERDVLVDQNIHSFHKNGLILFIIGMIGSTIVCFTLIVIIAKRL